MCEKMRENVKSMIWTEALRIYNDPDARKLGIGFNEARAMAEYSVGKILAKGKMELPAAPETDE